MAYKSGAWFNGVDAYVETQANSLNIGTDTIIIAVEAYIKKTGVIAGKYYFQQGGFYIEKNLFNKVRLVVHGSGTIDYIEASASDSPEDVYIIAVVSQDSIALYKNGVLIGSKTPTISIGDTTNPFIIGRAQPSGYFCGGLIRKLAVFKNIDITGKTSNIEQLLNTYDPELYYDPTYGHFLDLSGNNNHGIPHNIEFIGVNKKSSLYFNSSNQSYVSTPVYIGNRTRYGIMADVYIEDVNKTCAYIYNEKDNAGSGLLKLSIESGNIVASIRNNNGDVQTVTKSISRGFNRVGLYIDDSNIEVYANGEAVSQSLSITNVRTSNVAAIGRDPVGGCYFDGYIKKLSIGSHRRFWERAKYGDYSHADIANIDLSTGVPIDLLSGQILTKHNTEDIGINTKSGLWFPGTSGSYVDVGDLGNVDFSTGTLFVELENIKGIDFSGIVSRLDPATGYSGFAFQFFNPNTIKLHLTGDVYISGVLSEGNNKVVAKWGNGEAKLYVNGILQNSMAFTGDVNTTQNMRIGGLNYVDTSFLLKGLIKRVAIFNSDMDVTALTKWNIPSGAVAYWDFTTGSLKDWSGNGNDGTAYGDVKFIGI